MIKDVTQLSPYEYLSYLPAYTNLASVDKNRFTYLYKVWSRGLTKRECSLSFGNNLYIHNGVAVRKSDLTYLDSNQEERFVQKAVDLLSTKAKDDSNKLAFSACEIVKSKSALLLYISRPGTPANYGHFLTDSLPLVYALSKKHKHRSFYDESLDGCEFLLENPPRRKSHLKAVFLSLLAAFDIPVKRVHWISRGQVLEKRAAVYCGLKKHPAIHNPYVLKIMRDAIQSTFSIDNASPIFLSRGNTDKRAIQNEAQLLNALKEVLPGLSKIDCAKENCEVQLHKCRNASILIGIMGANMSNFIAASPGTPCVFITPVDMPGLYFWDICNALTLPYIEYRVKELSKDSSKKVELSQKEISEVVTLAKGVHGNLHRNFQK